jgi:ankyrin repeat protein
VPKVSVLIRWAAAPVLVLALLSCSPARENARKELAGRGLEFNGKTFFDRVRAGDAEIVKLFIGAGMPPDARDGGFTPLLEAARRGHEEVVSVLIDAGADVDVPDSYGVTPLMFSLISGAAKSARQLIEKGATVNARDIDGRTALVEALTTENDIPDEVIAALIAHGADVNVRIAGGLTPLMIAASGSSRLLRMLIEAGADINAKDDSGVSVLRMALDNPGNAAMLEAAGARL